MAFKKNGICFVAFKVNKSNKIKIQLKLVKRKLSAIRSDLKLWVDITNY